MKKEPTDLGANRTGIALSPIDSGKLIEGAAAAKPSSEVDGKNVSNMRASYIEQKIPVGSMPPPMTPQGMVNTAKSTLQGKKPTVLLDKLGERLAFERTGVRLYELLVAKCKTLAPQNGQLIARLTDIMQDEMQHFETVKEAIAGLGGDPTAMTPCADVVGVNSMGLLQTISDPRTTVTQSLNAILIVEAADNEGWTMLIKLCQEANEKSIAESFTRCAQKEATHLTFIREMLSQFTMQELKNQHPSGS